ncbi:MAG: serine/threonine protein kinase, partial [Planctomycetales bacterium]|nr:serine/threonine protein kinase [Planctomycetales bacterium]
LGRGGMGIVMRVFDPALNRECALKVLAPEFGSSGTARARFSREAKSAAAVVHPHVVPIQTVDEHDGMPYLIMPVVEGRSLQQQVTRNGPLSVTATLRIAAQIADGLAAAHRQGLVHRDIKPANILLENGVERVQITDFGLARAIDDASMTRSGVIAGTPQYMSPEQAHGDDIDHRSDLFSLGSVIYYMLSGRSPFRADSTMGVLNRICNDSARSLRTINNEVPDWLDSTVMKLLQKQPDDRYQSASEVCEVLNGWLAHLQNPTTVAAPNVVARNPSSIAARFSVRRRLIALGLMLVGVAGLATVLALQTGTGTLHIETDIDTNVPITIRQDGQAVQRLTVSKDGAIVRLRSGSYLIDLDAGDSARVTLDNQLVTVSRGEDTVATIREVSQDAVQVETQQERNGTPDDQTNHDYLVWEDERHVRLNEQFAKSLELTDSERYAIDKLLSEYWDSYVGNERFALQTTIRDEGRIRVEVLARTTDRYPISLHHRQLRSQQSFRSKLDEIIDGQKRVSLNAIPIMRGDEKDQEWTGHRLPYPSLLGWDPSQFPVTIDIWKSGSRFHWSVTTKDGSSSLDGPELPPELRHYWTNMSNHVSRQAWRDLHDALPPRGVVLVHGDVSDWDRHRVESRCRAMNCNYLFTEQRFLAEPESLFLF